jgi:hypothetical protein
VDEVQPEEQKPGHSRYGVISVMIAMVNLALICWCIFAWLLSAPVAHGTGYTPVREMEAIIALALVGLFFGWIGGGQARSGFWKGVIVLGGLFNGLALLFVGAIRFG